MDYSLHLRLNATTLSRNSKGTIIKATILEPLVQSFASADKTFKMDSIVYGSFLPKEALPLPWRDHPRLL